MQRFHFTYQESREFAEAARDLAQWGQPPVEAWIKGLEPRLNRLDEAAGKKYLFRRLREHLQSLRETPKSYALPAAQKPKPPKLNLRQEVSDKKILGLCPVYSEETVCCNLHTIDAVENCGFGCSYCTIQTFYGDKVVFDANLAEKLEKIALDPAKFYHIGTGQSSDSLMWGNRHGILDSLCAFAARYPNVLLEFKTKSANVRYFLENKIPRNVVLSWSLNTEAVIANEEHFTASLEDRLRAACCVADRKIPVAFHFHPMVWYAGWESDYAALAERVKSMFSPEEVLFLSLGSVTLIKPVMKAIRAKTHATKILQMPMARDPKGKWTYPDPLKVRMFKTLLGALGPWRERVFAYLCMEKPAIWKETFGFVYPDNKAFEVDFARKIGYLEGKKMGEMPATILENCR